MSTTLAGLSIYRSLVPPCIHVADLERRRVTLDIGIIHSRLARHCPISNKWLGRSRPIAVGMADGLIHKNAYAYVLLPFCVPVGSRNLERGLNIVRILWVEATFKSLPRSPEF